MVLPPRGLAGALMGQLQIVKPKAREVGVAPAMVIHPSAAAPTLVSFSQNAPEAATDPAIELGGDPDVTLLEVREPPLNCPVELADDRRQRVPIGPFGRRTDRVLELLKALLPRPAKPALEVIPQKI